MSNSESKIEEISNLLLEYSAGNYEFQGSISDNIDQYDMIISGINMLGEELMTTNVSKEYFSSIFNAVTDLVMIVNKEGELTDFNSALELSLGKTKNELHAIKLDALLVGKTDLLTSIKTLFKGGTKSLLFEKKLKGKNSTIIGQFTCSQIINRFDEFKGFLISVKDITEQKLNEQRILQAIFSTEQNQQKRVADDLHDSIGQELSMTKLMISNLRKHSQGNLKQLELISTCTQILDGSIRHLREICFNLMPSVLIRGGLNMAISDLRNKLVENAGMKVFFSKNSDLNRLDSNLEIVIYRISQEFINNMIKHAEATELVIELGFSAEEETISLYLKDNGKGFNLEKINEIEENRGYENLKTKVKAFNGEVEMRSSPGKGTSTFVKFPILNSNEEN
jgi:PAS domain S-box-containing protein